MSRIQFDKIAPATNFDSLPIAFIGTSSRGSAVTRLLLLVPAMAILLVPLSLVIAHAQSEPAALNTVAARPISAVQVAIGVAIWCGMFLLPLREIVMRLGSRRTVRIDSWTVDVTDKTPFGTTTWQASLTDYAGIAHHVRTSLSGTRHELILVNKDATRNVLVAVADRIPQSTLDRAKALLGLPEVPARALYDRPVSG